MLQWLKDLFSKRELPKKEVGGFEVADGIVIGPSYFSQGGMRGNILNCPPVWAFNFGITNVLNRLSQVGVAPSLEEFQTIFNSLLDDLISDVLIYFENRLKIITIKNKLKYKINSIGEAVKAYKKLASIDLRALSDVEFLTALDRVRGGRHHSNRRYGVDFSIAGNNYETPAKLVALTRQVRGGIQSLDEKLSLTHKDYDVRVERFPSAVKVEWTAIRHAFDMTDAGKIVTQRPTTGLDMRQIKYFSFQVNYKK